MSYMSSKPPSTTAAGGPVTATKSLFWTVYYFFYFLLTGQPEWKCESHQHEPLIACCGRQASANEENANFKWNSSQSAASSRSNGYFNEPYQQNGHRYSSGPREGIVGRVKGLASDSWNWLKRAGRWIGQKTIQGVKVVGKGLGWVWEKLKSVWNYFRSFQLQAARSKSLPPPQVLSPKPFCPDSPSFNKVTFDPDATFQAFKHNMDASIKDQLEEKLQPPTQHYHQQEEDVDERTLREPSVPPPPPPPPPPQKPIRIERSVEPPEVVARITAPLPQMESYHERKEDKKEHKVPRGVPEMAKEVMAELSGRLSRGPSAQREMTQSCHPDMPEWKDENRYDRSGSATPWRASSVGPTMRRLEQVVSRLDPQDNEASDNEAQYVFRPPPTRPADYQMGRSVFNPLEEAERMRESINKKSHQETRGYESPSVTPSSYYTERRYNGENELRQRAKTVEPSQCYVRPFTPSLAYSSAPFTSHTARRSKTPVSFDRGNNFAYDRNEISDGVVNNTARRWPPVSNATGAPFERDNWIQDIMGRNDEDGLITTMCRRVVERKTEDNWKWRDEAGRLVDEQNQRKWKGELDTVVRDGPEQGRQWSRTVEVKPNGATLFQDVSRQYDRDYVVESVVRNY